MNVSPRKGLSKLPVYQSVSLSVCLSGCISISMPDAEPISLYVCLSVCLPAVLPGYLACWLSLYLSIYLHLCQHINHTFTCINRDFYALIILCGPYYWNIFTHIRHSHPPSPLRSHSKSIPWHTAMLSAHFLTLISPKQSSIVSYYRPQKAVFQ